MTPHLPPCCPVAANLCANVNSCSSADINYCTKTQGMHLGHQAPALHYQSTQSCYSFACRFPPPSMFESDSPAQAAVCELRAISLLPLPVQHAYVLVEWLVRNCQRNGILMGNCLPAPQRHFTPALPCKSHCQHAHRHADD
jgi:hypothetical protein